MSVLAEVFSGLSGGVLSGLGDLAVKIRQAVTGTTPISAEAQGELLKIAAQVEAIKQTADFELQKAQLEINKLDAASGSSFRGGWRPMAGWAAVFAVCIYPVIHALLPWLIAMGGAILGKDVSHLPVLPSIPADESANLLWALLGFGGLRTYDKIKGKG